MHHLHLEENVLLADYATQENGLVPNVENAPVTIVSRVAVFRPVMLNVDVHFLDFCDHN